MPAFLAARSRREGSMPVASALRVTFRPIPKPVPRAIATAKAARSRRQHKSARHSRPSSSLHVGSRMRRSRSASVAFLISLLTAGACSRKEIALAGSPLDLAHGGAPVTAPAASARHVTERDAGAYPAVHAAAGVSLVLRVEPSELAGSWDVVARIPELSLSAKVTSFKEPVLCGVVPFSTGVGDDARSNRNGGENPVAIAVTCSASERPVHLSQRDERILIGDSELLLPSNTRIAFPTVVQQARPTDCSGTTETKTVDVKMARKQKVKSSREGSDDAIVLSIGAQEVWSRSMNNAPSSCGSNRLFPKSTQATYGCSFGESGVGVEVRMDQHRVWLDVVESGYKPTMLVRRFGMQLACGSRLRFVPYSWRDSRWQPYGRPCSNACQQQSELCEDRCYRRYADDYGVLSDAGSRCTERCRLHRDEQCSRACASRGQYP
jgi:hypothetical protein